MCEILDLLKDFVLLLDAADNNNKSIVLFVVVHVKTTANVAYNV